MTRPHIPQKISDYIVDFLQDEKKTLRQCCLVSKSWVPRAQQHLFYEISFKNYIPPVAWKLSFPDPANSPLKFVRSLVVDRLSITAADAEEGGWIRGFSNVVRLEVSRVQNHFILIRSLPRLQDLYLRGYSVVDDRNDAIFHPSTPPRLVETLRLSLDAGTKEVIHRLLNLQNVIHPRRLRCTWYHGEDVEWIAALVKECSNTLEHVDLRDARWARSVMSQPSLPLIDLSEATKLRVLTLRSAESSIVWVINSLKTITSRHKDLQEVLIRPDFFITPLDNCGNLKKTVGKDYFQHWRDLDYTLTQLSESHGVRVKVVYYSNLKAKETKVQKCMEKLFPTITQRFGVEMGEFVEFGARMRDD